MDDAYSVNCDNVADYADYAHLADFVDYADFEDYVDYVDYIFLFQVHIWNIFEMYLCDFIAAQIMQIM